MAAACLVAVLAGAGTPGSAGAKKACVTVTATAPVVGTQTRTQCSPELGPQFQYNETVWDCKWVPPLGVSECVTVTVPLPV